MGSTSLKPDHLTLTLNLSNTKSQFFSLSLTIGSPASEENQWKSNEDIRA